VYRYLIRRILLMAPTLVGVAVLVFILMRMIPGDIVELRLGGEGGMVTEEQIQKERARLGLDRSLTVQFVDWMVGLATFDLGRSMWTGRKVTEEIWVRFPVSLQIAVMSTIIATILAIPLGTLAALKQDTWLDYIVRIFSIAGLATPSFWLGIMMILFLLIFFHWSPPISYEPIWRQPFYNLSMLIWPAMATGYRYSAVAMRMTRSTVIEVMREDYIRTARAKGLVDKLIINRHALTNAMLPVITVIGIEFAFLMGGLVVTEQVFNLNGIGRLFVQSVGQKDYTLVQGLVLLVAFVFVFTNFVVDILYAWLDPRIHYT
jgi:peptide/nickel transport system permease protein